MRERERMAARRWLICVAPANRRLFGRLSARSRGEQQLQQQRSPVRTFVSCSLIVLPLFIWLRWEECNKLLLLPHQKQQFRFAFAQ